MPPNPNAPDMNGLTKSQQRRAALAEIDNATFGSVIQPCTLVSPNR